MIAPKIIALKGLKPTVIVIPVGVDIFIEAINRETIITAPGIAKINNASHWVASNDREPPKGFPKKNAKIIIIEEPMNIGHAVKVNAPYFFISLPAFRTYNELQKAAKNIKKSPFKALGARPPILSLNVTVIPVIATNIAIIFSKLVFSIPKIDPNISVMTGWDVKTIAPLAAVVFSNPAAKDHGNAT